MTTLDWLLDSDPAIRWQVFRDLAHAPADVVMNERARVAVEGWGARLLALQGEDGQWAGGACFPARHLDDSEGNQGQPWISTLPTLQLLHDFGVDPNSEQVRRAVTLVKDHCRWEHAGQPFFSGEVEPCINGRSVTLGVYFHQDVEGIVARLLSEQLEDGGWNCEAERGSVRSSFDTTINVLEGLLAYERATDNSSQSVAARDRGEEYLLERKLFRRKSTGEIVNSAWLQFSFPTYWHYDVLRALEGAYGIVKLEGLGIFVTWIGWLFVEWLRPRSRSARLRRIAIARAGDWSISVSGGPLGTDSGRHHGVRETVVPAWRI